MSILGDLARQRETIVHARDTLHSADDNISKARRVLSSMSKRVLANKIIMGGIRWAHWGGTCGVAGGGLRPPLLCAVDRRERCAARACAAPAAAHAPARLPPPTLQRVPFTGHHPHHILPCARVTRLVAAGPLAPRTGTASSGVSARPARRGRGAHCTGGAGGTRAACTCLRALLPDPALPDTRNP